MLHPPRHCRASAGGGGVKKYVVAINQKEAESLMADEHWRNAIGHDTRQEADVHLKHVKAPPTDPYYASQYRVYVVDWEPAPAGDEVRK